TPPGPHAKTPWRHATPPVRERTPPGRRRLPPGKICVPANLLGVMGRTRRGSRAGGRLRNAPARGKSARARKPNRAHNRNTLGAAPIYQKTETIFCAGNFLCGEGRSEISETCLSVQLKD